MAFSTLPTELLTQIFLSLPTLASVTALASTCHRFHSAFHSSKRLLILHAAADAEYGPIDDIIQLVTQNASQPAHIRRSVPISEALLKQIAHVGLVAQKYEEIYPFKKWKTEYSHRRLLTAGERHRLRRAIYRLWLFDRAFHTPTHVRTCRSTPEALRERTALLLNFSTPDLADMLDMHAVLRDLVARNICPSNGKVRQKLRKRFPEGGQLLVGCNIHLNYPPSAPSGHAVVDGGWRGAHYAPASRFHDAGGVEGWGVEGWGDEIAHYYVVEDMMKLDPEQLLFLRDRCPFKAQVESYVRGLGEWFGNNGETFSETLGLVVRQRGGDVQVLREEVELGGLGIVVWGDE